MYVNNLLQYFDISITVVPLLIDEEEIIKVNVVYTNHGSYGSYGFLYY